MLKLLLSKLKNNLPNYGDHVLYNSLVIVLALLSKRTVCLYKLKGQLGHITGNLSTTPASNYKRLTRYFQSNASSLLWIDLVKFGLSLLRLKVDELIIDGTSWERGQTKHHFQTLCIVYRNVAIPIIWLDLEKKGASGFEERKELFDLAFEHFDLAGKTLLADREYIGTQWFSYLISNGLHFIIRSRDYTYFDQIDKSGTKSMEQMIRKVLRSKLPDKTVSQICTIGGEQMRIVVAKNPSPEAKEPFLILLTTLDQNPYQIVQLYLRRWKIEHCFKQLKSNGFDLEAINLGSVERRRLLFGLVVLAYIVSVTEGMITYHRVGIKKYANATQYRAQSVFRYGCDLITSAVRDVTQLMKFMIKRIRQVRSRYRSIDLLHVQ